MKKAIVFLLCLCLFTGIMAVGAGATMEDNAVAILIDGDIFAPPAPMILLDGTTYVQLRAFSLTMDENAVINWNNITKTASVRSQNLEIQVTVGQQYLIANGRYLYIPDKCFMYENNTMVPVRQLAKAFGASVGWNNATKTVTISAKGAPIESGGTIYDQDELYWLSRIIFSESGAEVLEGQIGVGNVVLNRVTSSLYPCTIHDVVFDTLYGVQFTPIASGTIHKTPSEKSVIAAKLVLDGAVTTGDSLFFLNEAIATSTWIVYNRDFVVTIGDHSFYA